MGGKSVCARAWLIVSEKLSHARAQTDFPGGGRPPPPQCQQQKRERERERKKENKVACMHVKLPPFNHFQSKIKYKFVLYEENTGHMHQIAPLTNQNAKSSHCGWGDTPSHTLPLARYFYRPP